MIDLVYGVIRISNKCSCVEIFDQQGNPNFTFPYSDSLSGGVGLGSLMFYFIVYENLGPELQ